MYQHRFDQFEGLDNLNKARLCQTLALLLLPNRHPRRPDALRCLGDAYLCRFLQLGKLVDLNQAIEAYDQAVPGTPDRHPNKPDLLSNLGTSHICRYEQIGNLEDLNKSTEYRSQAELLFLDSDPRKSMLLRNLGNCYQIRFDRLGALADVNMAIECYLKCLSLAHCDQQTERELLNSIGGSYYSRAEYFGDRADIDQAINYQNRAILLTPEGHSFKPRLLQNLGSSHLMRAELFGDLSDIHMAIAYQGQSVRLVSGHLDRLSWLSNLGNSYRHIFERFGELSDIDKAIDCQNQAVLLAPENHASMPGWLNNLANSYLCRFDLLGELVDVDKAIEYQKKALVLTPEGDPDTLRWISHLGDSYLRRFQRLGEPSDADKAIDYHSQAVSLGPDGQREKPGLLHALGTSFLHRFQKFNKVSDLNQGIRCLTEAMSVPASSQRDMATRLSDLGCAYNRRYELLGGLTDADNAIEHLARALQIIPHNHPIRPGLLCNLGTSFINRYEGVGKRSDLHAGVKSFEQAAMLSIGHPETRFKAAREWAWYSCHLYISPQQAFQRTMELVREMAWLGITVNQRYEILMTVGDAVLEAASFAIAMKAYDHALEWLEEGRSIVWNQMLQLRKPLNDLSVVHPTLAERLEDVGRQLERASSRPVMLPSNGPLDLERNTQIHHRLATEWNQLLAQARQIPGFEDFMARKADALVGVAKDGPVVVLNVYSASCDALVIRPNSNEIAHIPLKGFSNKKCVDARKQLLSLVGQRGGRAGGFKRSKTAQTPEDMFKGMLKTLWLDVVKPVLEFLEYTHSPPDSELPHITWCTTGEMSFLPLHAAGCYDGAQPNALDLVVSSYTPTLSALLAPVRSPHSPHSGVLLVGQEYTKGLATLPSTVHELAAIRQHIKETQYLQLDGKNATVDAVLNAMDEYSWVHLACHATQNKEDPSRSAFHLSDGNLMLSTITKRSFANKGLAFLSACQTATGDENLPDEAVHLAAGMLMAGYPSVIATMWAIQDEDGPVVARDVYSELLKDGEMDHTGASRALHKAVQELRREVGVDSFERWIPFIHLGC